MKRRTFIQGSCAAAASGVLHLSGFFNLKAYAANNYRYQVGDSIFQDRFSPILNLVAGEEDAATFLRSATLGPTLAEINDLLTLNDKSEWIDQQIEASFDGSEFAEKAFDASRGRYIDKQGWYSKLGEWMSPPSVGEAWYSTGVDALNGDADRPGQDGRPYLDTQITQTALLYNNPVCGSLFDVTDPDGIKAPGKALLNKCVWMLSKLIPVTDPGGGIPSNGYFEPAWHELLSRHAFGRYEDLLEAVTFNFSMANMLTHWKNQEGSPDENFAREIIQLFTLGLFRLNDGGGIQFNAEGIAVENYEREDVSALARVMTGFVNPFRTDGDVYYQAEVPEPERGDGEFRLVGTRDRAVRRYFNAFYRGKGPSTGSPVPDNYRTLDPAIINRGHRKRPSTVEAGKQYRVQQNNNNEATAALQTLGAISTSAGSQFVATANGNSSMTAGYVEEMHYAAPGMMPRMKIFSAVHDFGAKNLPTIGLDIPPGMDPESEIRLAIRHLVRHSSTAPYVCSRLIRMATTSNPSPSYVGRVVRVFRAKVDDPRHMAHVFKAIFLDPEALGQRSRPNIYGRLRDPSELMFNVVRSFGMTRITAPQEYDTAQNRNWRPPAPYYTRSSNGVAATPTAPNGKVAGYIAIPPGGGAERDPGAIFQTVWPSRFPSIFGPYPPEGSQFPASADGLLFPEGVVYTAAAVSEITRVIETTVNSLPDIYRGPAYTDTGNSDGRSAIGWNFAQRNRNKIVMIALDFLGDLLTPSDFVRKIDLLLTGGETPQVKLDQLIAILASMPTSTLENREARVGLAAATIANGPEFFGQFS
ncbi:MAG: DUF1800 family protein [Wenzhouxiangella sp.]|nr:MAG: DUF1800 family protein [Wenzhouxiangella sp.]